MAEMVYDYPRRDEDEDACIIVNAKSGKPGSSGKKSDGIQSVSAPEKKSDKPYTKDASTASNNNDSTFAKAKKHTCNKKDPNAPKRPRGRPPKKNVTASSNTKDTAIVLSDDEDAESGPSAKIKVIASSTKSKQSTLPPVPAFPVEPHPAKISTGGGFTASHGYDMAPPTMPAHHHGYGGPHMHAADSQDVIYALQHDLTAERSLRIQLEAECAHLRAALADHEAQFVTRLAKETQAMQQRLQEVIRERDELGAAYGGVSVRVQALAGEVSMLENKLKEAEEENQRLRAQIQNEVDKDELTVAHRIYKREGTPIPVLRRAGDDTMSMAEMVNAAETSAAGDLMQLVDNNNNNRDIGPASPVNDHAAHFNHTTQHRDRYPSTKHRDCAVSVGEPRIAAPTTCPETFCPPEHGLTSLSGTIRQHHDSHQTNISSAADRAVDRAYRVRSPSESVSVRSCSQANMNDRNRSLSPRPRTVPPVNPNDAALSGQLPYNNPTVPGRSPVPNRDDDVFLPGQNETHASLHRAFVDKYGSLSREQLAAALRNAELAAAEVCDELLEAREKWHVAKDRLVEVEEELGEVKGELERIKGVVERVMREHGEQAGDGGTREGDTVEEKTGTELESADASTAMTTTGQNNALGELPTDIPILHNMLANLRSERNNLHAELYQLQTRLNDLQIMHEKTKAELAERNKEYDEVEAEVRAGQSHWAQEIRLMNLKLDMLRSEASTSSSTITSLQAQISDLEKEKIKLVEEKRELESKLEKVKKEFEDEGRKLVKEMNASWEEEVLWLEGELDRARVECEKLGEVCKRQREEIRELRERLEEMVKKDGLLNMELDTLGAKHTETKNKKAKDGHAKDEKGK